MTDARRTGTGSANGWSATHYADPAAKGFQWDLYSGTTRLAIVSNQDPASYGSASADEEGWQIATTHLPIEPAPSQNQQTNSVARLLNRLRQLRNLSAGRGGLAAPANKASVDNALQFVARAELPLAPIATLDDDGSAVIEMESEGQDFFADISFGEDGTIEIYRREVGSPSLMLSGRIEDQEIESFLRQKIGVLI